MRKTMVTRKSRRTIWTDSRWRSLSPIQRWECMDVFETAFMRYIFTDRPTPWSSSRWISAGFHRGQTDDFSYGGEAPPTILVSDVFQQLGEPAFRSKLTNSDVMRAYDPCTVRAQSPIPISAWFD